MAAALTAILLAAGACGPGPLLRPPSVPGRPYLRLYGRAEGFAVWVVDGRYVRERLDEEFTNFGQHLEFRFIPEGEFWLDEEAAPGEAPFFVAHLLVEHRLMAGGMRFGDALDRADEAEKAERLKTALGREGNALRDAGRTAELLARVHRQLLPEWSDGVKVWVVDGELVRDVYDIDFTEGGHGRVYKFVPAGEVWLDDDLTPAEREFVLLHELHERALMGMGWVYADAHRDSSRIERYFRRYPAGLDAALRAEMAKNRS